MLHILRENDLPKLNTVKENDLKMLKTILHVFFH